MMVQCRSLHPSSASQAAIRSAMPVGSFVRRASLRATVLLASWATVAFGLAGCHDDGAPPPALPVSILAQPASISVVDGTSATFTVAATGGGLSLQWQQSVDQGATFVAIADAVSASITIPVTHATMDGFQYRVLVSGRSGTLTSSAATLSVAPAPLPPSLVAQPVARSVNAGAGVSFSVTASGTSLAYQWQVSTDGVAYVDIVGATLATLVLSNVAVTDDGKRYRVVVRNAVDAVTSGAVLLTVAPPPVVPQIVTQPTTTSVVAGTVATFSVVATGTPSPGYQWQQSSDGGATFVDIAAATAPVFTTAATALADNGRRYRVGVFNTAGQVISAAATLGVSPAQTAPVITLQPLDQSVAVPAPGVFVVAASASPSATYQWQVSTDGGNVFIGVNGATGPVFRTAPTSLSDDGTRVRVIVANAVGTVTSRSAQLAVGPHPAISITTRVATGLNHSCAVKVDGTLSCWGNNGGGQLGDGTTASRAVTGDVFGLSDVVDVVAGAYFTCALKADGSVLCWGDAAGGKLGIGPTDRFAFLVPQPVTGLSSVTALSSGMFHTCALRGDGTVSCWGVNLDGELGDGTTTYRYAPTLVPGLANIVAIAAGGSATCALRADAAVFCWGDNSSGQLGDGTLATRLVPTRVVGLGPAASLSVGRSNACAVLNDGTVSCWGSSAGSGVVDGAMGFARPTPATVVGVTSPVQLTAGSLFACAVRGDGTVACWGAIPGGLAVPGIAGVVALSRGAVASDVCAATASGTLFCWGANEAGQLALGNYSFFVSAPTVVPGVTVVP